MMETAEGASGDMAEQCDVCVGSGRYPIIDRYGTQRYEIRCPECLGSGVVVAEAEGEPSDWPPASTACQIKTLDELRTYLAVERET